MKKHKWRSMPSPRLPGFDYATPGAYFITICTSPRIWHFGDIAQGEMILSEPGIVVEEEWLRTDLMWEYVFFDEWVIMPDHFHALIWFSEKGFLHMPSYKSLPSTPGYKAKMISPSANLGSLIRGFKGAVTRRLKALGYHEFKWQRLYHDRIIRNEKEWKSCQQYIRSNPEKWLNRSPNL